MATHHPQLTLRHRGKNFLIQFFSENDHIARTAKATNTFYEIHLLEYLRRLLPRGEWAIDVGANIGNHSVFFANFIAEKVISIEANPELLPILEKNLENNTKLSKIIPKGLGKEKGTANIHFPLQDNVGAGRLLAGPGSIPITTLDEIAPKSGVFLVKVDVEGMEMDVLSGATNLIKHQHPNFVIEAATQPEFDNIRKFLSPYGYTMLAQWNDTPTHHFAFHPSIFQKYLARLIVFQFRIGRAIRRRLSKILP